MSLLPDDPKTGVKVASLLLKIEAVRLNPELPFVWASGWQSPIYCDNRLTLGYPAIRSYIKKALTDKIKLLFPQCEAIAGVATAGIPQGVLVAEALEVPFLYVRSMPKGHGLENLIEGKIVKGQKVVVVEDLISTGASSLNAVEALRKAQIKVLGMAAIFTYGFDIALKNFETADLPWFSLCNYHLLIDYAASNGIISEEQLSLLEAWRDRPDEWSIVN